MNRTATAAALVLAIASASCTHTYYWWGSYDASIAAMYSTGTGFDAAAMVDRLVREVEEAEHRGERVGPGIRAHVGVLLCEAGNTARGIAFLDAEKAAFPESAPFLDGMLARMQRAK